ncbi:MAG TPA: DUF1622 domain-containing protein [Phycisphaerae bacterium]|nr:DUF1622 domain-containing protein [Phycisphaerae bacterium]HOI54831.1 DUF1622 domain-containing protein [Phycisphaerae bacterium]
MEQVQEVLRFANTIVVAVCQFLAMVVITIGIAKALRIFLRDALTPGRSAAAIRESRLELGHSFSLALGFLIGASILKTTLAPTWTDIGQLAAIIAIRTILNYFLLHDISVQSETVDQPTLIATLFRRKRKAAHLEASAHISDDQVPPPDKKEV